MNSGFSSDESHEEILVVLDGRFLPARNLKIERETDIGTTWSMSGKSVKTGSQEKITVSFVTPRRPYPRPKCESMFIRTADMYCEIRHILLEGQERSSDDSGVSYFVTVTASEITERSLEP